MTYHRLVAATELTLTTASGSVSCVVVAHPRARRLTLRATPTGLHLSTPPGTPAAVVAHFLERSQQWIDAHARPGPPPLRDGDTMALLDRRLTLRVDIGGSRATVRVADDLLVVRRPQGAALGEVVERWYRAQARTRLGPMADRLAAMCGQTVERLAIADPRGRWGSCSARGRVMLSWRLMLAPEAVARQVVAHEVAHLAHLNHGPDFWALVNHLDPRAAGRATGCAAMAPCCTGGRPGPTMNRPRRHPLSGR